MKLAPGQNKIFNLTFTKLMKNFEIYTDGSCKGRWGSWSYLVLHNDEIIHEASARTRKTNSNRMEFQAAIEGLKSLLPGSIITLYTDCRILIENIPMFSEWQSNNWLKKNNHKIPNVDQFIILNKLIQERTITWKWIKAHSGNIHNERCDQLCVLARTEKI